MSARRPGARGQQPTQQFFSFVPQDIQDEITACRQRDLEAKEQRDLRIVENARKRLARKVLAAKTLDIDWKRHSNLLEQPLLSYEVSDLDVQPAAVAELPVRTRYRAEEDEAVDWEVDDRLVSTLHDAVLEYSLNVLKTKGNAEEKIDVLRWIWSPDTYAWVSREVDGNITYIAVPRIKIPFTFQMCCAASGLDYKRMREGLAIRLAPVLKALNLESIIK